jgi:hypothetical protein
MLPTDKLHRTLAINALSGSLLGLIVVALLLALDVGGLRRLAFNDEAGFISLILLGGGFVITCASLMMGSAIMMAERSRDDDDDHSGGGGGRFEPVVVRVVSPRVRR